MKQKKRKAKKNKTLKRPLCQIPIVDNKQSLYTCILSQAFLISASCMIKIIIKNPI